MFADVMFKEGDRWAVQLDSREMVKARPANLLVIGGWPKEQPDLPTWVLQRASEYSLVNVIMPEERPISEINEDEDNPEPGQGIEAKWQLRQDMLELLRAKARGYGLAEVATLDLPSICGAAAVRAADIELTACSCTRLRELRIDGCGCMTDALVGRLAVLPSLSTLSLARCAALTDVGIARLVAGVPKDREDEPSPRGPFLTDQDAPMRCVH